jgi:UDP-N-acetylmuramoyl-tripeptide--D-alanyl-D-alanine ligase
MPLFIALKGEQFDGHAHVQAAIDGGCVAALVARELAIDAPQVVVADTERALAAFAAAVQRERSTTVLAITGSNGKTSVKTLLLSILQQVGSAYASPGNRNNEIGLPLAVLDAPDDARFAVYEMGAGKPGDIAYLTEIAPPACRAGQQHRAGAPGADGQPAGRRRDQGRDLRRAAADGVAVVNADDDLRGVLRRTPWQSPPSCCVSDGPAAVCSRARHPPRCGRLALRAGHAGRRHRQIAAAAAGPPQRAQCAGGGGAGAGGGRRSTSVRRRAGGRAAGRGPPGRAALRSGAVLVDDSYNANPGSLAAAIDTLANRRQCRWLVLGDMRELGPDESPCMRGWARRPRRAGIARLLRGGRAERAMPSPRSAMARRHYDSHDETLADALAPACAGRHRAGQGIARQRDGTGRRGLLQRDATGGHH